MSELRVKCHPMLNILVGTDGHVMVPSNCNDKAHWTLGSNKDGYSIVQIRGNRYRVHRLVVETFIGKIPTGYEVDHINRNRADNRVENLRIVTHSENDRNTAAHDRVTERGGTHRYENENQYHRELHMRHRERYRVKYRAYYLSHREEKLAKDRERYARRKLEKLSKCGVEEDA